MGMLRTWLASSSPIVKMLMAISITSMLAVGHKLYISPYLRKQKYLRAEDCAYTLIEQEENIRNATE